MSFPNAMAGRSRRMLTAAALAAVVTAAAAADAGPYAPYEFLIGEWEVGPESGGAPSSIARFTWGPNHSYMRYSVSSLLNGSETPHFEGILVYNAIQGSLDTLVELDLAGGRLEEKGTLSPQPDGSLLRDVAVFYPPGARLPPRGEVTAGPNGATGHFHQTFVAAGPDRVLTALTREAGAGWEATFPGSNHLAMTRRPDHPKTAS